MLFGVALATAGAALVALVLLALRLVLRALPWSPWWAKRRPAARSRGATESSMGAPTGSSIARSCARARASAPEPSDPHPDGARAGVHLHADAQCRIARRSDPRPRRRAGRDPA